MAISFINSAALAGGTRTSGSIIKPTSVAKGDVMVMVAYLELTGVAVTSSGWTEVAHIEQTNGTAYRMTVLYKVDDGSAGPYTIAWDGSSRWLSAEIVGYTGTAQTSPVEASAIAASASSTTVMRGPSITTKSANAMLVMLGTNSTGNRATPPTGMTERVDTAEVYAADVIQAVAGSSGNQDATLASAMWNAGALLSLAPSTALLPLDPSSGVASTSLALSATTAIPLSASSGIASTSLALSAKTAIPLNASSGVASTTLALSAKTALPLGAASGIATPSLALSTPVPLPLDASSGSASATLALTATPVVASPVHIFQPPPLRESWKLTTPSGRVYRWAEDEPKAENIPTNASYSSSMQGGYKDASLTLPRKPEHAYPDLERGSRLEAFTNGHRVWQGRLDRVPRASGDQIAVTPQAVGYIAAMEDDKSASEIFVDRDMGAWGDVSATRQLAIMKAGLTPQRNLSVAPDLGGNPLLSMLITGPFDDTQAEAMYDAGDGNRIARLYIGTVARVGLANDAFLTATPRAWDDDAATGEQIGTDYKAGGSPIDFSPATPARFMVLDWTWAGAGPVGASSEDVGFTYGGIVPIGDHGLTLYGTALDLGVLASDVIAYALGRWVPGVKFTAGPTGTIRPSSFVITNLAQKDRGTAGDIYRAADAFELSDFAIWDGPDGEPTAYYAPRGTFGRKWKARVREAQLQETGPQMDRVWNGVLVRYNDVDGTTRIVGPTGSDCAVTSDSLLDTDPLNPANELGIRKWTMLDMQGVALFTDAIRVGQRFLEESKALDSSGQATIVGYVMDAGGRVFPHTHMRAGDTISFVDASDPSPRRIVDVTHQRSSRSSQISLDSPPDSLEQLLARLNVALVRANLS